MFSSVCFARRETMEALETRHGERPAKWIRFKLNARHESPSTRRMAEKTTRRDTRRSLYLLRLATEAAIMASSGHAFLLTATAACHAFRLAAAVVCGPSSRTVTERDGPSLRVTARRKTAPGQQRAVFTGRSTGGRRRRRHNKAAGARPAADSGSQREARGPVISGRPPTLGQTIGLITPHRHSQTQREGRRAARPGHE